jgi:hypothetical protein
VPSPLRLPDRNAEKMTDLNEDVLVDWSTVPTLIKRKAYMVEGTPFTVDPLDRHQIVPLRRWFAEAHGLAVHEPGVEYDI